MTTRSSGVAHSYGQREREDLYHMYMSVPCSKRRFHNRKAQLSGQPKPKLEMDSHGAVKGKKSVMVCLCGHTMKFARKHSDTAGVKRNRRARFEDKGIPFNRTMVAK
jgi:hypothetical protein